MRRNGMKIDCPKIHLLCLHILYTLYTYFLGRVINFKSEIIMRFFFCYFVLLLLFLAFRFGCLRANKSVAVSRLIYKVSHNHFLFAFLMLLLPDCLRPWGKVAGPAAVAVPETSSPVSVFFGGLQMTLLSSRFVAVAAY